MPILTTTLEIIYPDYYQFSPARFSEKNRIVKCKMTIDGEVMQNGKPVKAQIQGGGSIQASFISLYPAIAMALLICWPGLSRKIRWMAAFGISLLIFCITVIDLSLTMMSSIEASLHFNLTDQNIRTFIIQFINNGGRQFTAIIVAWSSISFARWAGDSCASVS